MVEYLYHITKKENIGSILQEGIIPKKSNGITLSSSKKYNYVFLTNDISRIVREQAGKSFMDKHKMVSLKIDVTDLNIEPHKYIDGMTYTLSDYEFVVDKITPDRIISIKHISYEEV